MLHSNNIWRLLVLVCQLVIWQPIFVVVVVFFVCITLNSESFIMGLIFFVVVVELMSNN